MISRLHLRHRKAEYEFDVHWNVVQLGGDGEKIDQERMDEYYWGGWFPEEAARMEVRTQRVLGMI